MKCPNCGRNVRSKTQCAYCGYDFKSGDTTAKETQETKRSERVEDTQVIPTVEPDYGERRERIEPIVTEPTDFKEVDDFPSASSDTYETRSNREPQAVIPKTKRKGGSVVWGIVKLLLAVAVVFLLFLFGPRLIGQVMDYFNSDDNIFVQTFGNKDESDEILSEVESEGSVAENEETTESSEESTESDSALTLINQSVELAEYPTINVTMSFEEALAAVDQSTFKFYVGSNGEETELSEYSLFKEGSDLVLSFNDPTLEVVAVSEQEQTLRLVSENLNVDEAVTYTLPNVNIDKEQAQQFTDSINNHLGDLGDVSAVFFEAGADVPFTYDNQSVDADSLIAWFVIERTFEAVAEGQIDLEATVTINDSLKAENDNGTIATTEADASYTYTELLNYVIQERDVSAMNHLIQETGGLNEFNLWLNESGYFATRLTAPLSLNEAGLITGAMTSAQDLGNLLGALASNSLIDETGDATIKEMLLQSPFSEKYPEGMEGVVTRFELMSSDDNASRQYYAGILEMEETSYVVVMLANNITDAEATVSAISTTINELVTYFSTGSLEVEETEAETEAESEEEVIEEAESSQVEIIEETPVQETTPTEELSPSGEPTTELYDGKPTENYYWFGDEYRQGIWFQDESGSWKYR